MYSNVFPILFTGFFLNILILFRNVNKDEIEGVQNELSTPYMSIQGHYSLVRRDRKGSWVIIKFLMHLKKKEKNLQERVDT